MNILNLEDDKFKTIEVKGYKFQIRAIFPKDIIAIGRRRREISAGASIESLTADEFQYYENIATVDVCVEKMPKQFKQGESCLNWTDTELINLVAREIQEHTALIQEGLKKNRPVSGIEEE